jgi:hypothetical protein
MRPYQPPDPKVLFRARTEVEGRSNAMLAALGLPAKALAAVGGRWRRRLALLTRWQPPYSEATKAGAPARSRGGRRAASR